MNLKLLFKSCKSAFLIALAASIALAACKKNPIEEDDDIDVTNKEIVEIPAGSLIASVKWTKDKVYRLNGFVRVGRDANNTQGLPAVDNITLEIEAGTTIIGDRETKGTLIVQRGNKIIANGTVNAPIIFTSEREVGLREPGDWGGVVICGKAGNNQPNSVAELEGGYGGWHGGIVDNDNSGSLKYVRIEYAGVPINPNQEVNSLTLGSVGSGTIIENIQCSFGLDDAFEWFGGTVNCKNLIAYRCLDDDFDVDLGFRGTVQFALSIRDANLADQSGSNGFEVDNDGSGTAATPFTSAQFSNITVIGPKKDKDKTVNVQFQNAMHLRRNNKLKIYNSVFTAFPNGLFIDGNSTAANAASADLVIKNSILAGVEGWGTNGYGTGGSINFPNPKGEEIKATNTSGGVTTTILIGTQSASDWFKTTAFSNAVYPRWQDIGINGSIFDISSSPKLTPDSGSILLSGANFTGLSGFQTVTFRGAFGPDNWAQGWTNFNPQQVEYLNY